jgi:hypothetical protein
MSDQRILAGSNAGMRLIAQTSIYNSGDFARLEQYFRDNYTAAQLDEEPAERRAQAWQIVHEQIGRLRVRQVLGVDKHHVVALMTCEQHPGLLYLNEVMVEEPYPHKVSLYVHQHIGAAE